MSTVRLALSGTAGDDGSTRSKTQSRIVTFQYEAAAGLSPRGGQTLKLMNKTEHPDIRRAVCPPRESGGANCVDHHVGAGGLGKPTVRLAHVDGAQGDGALQGGEGNGPQIEWSDAPGLLVSYAYLDPFIKNQHRYRYRDWVMDSGAFTAHNSGKPVDLSAYIDKCLELLSKDPTLTEVFALDVIPKTPKDAAKAAEQGLANCEEMWRQGVPAIPCFHQGDPEEVLFAMAKQYPKIALGGVALIRGDQKRMWLSQCFARVWPKKIHGFGMAGEEIVYALPFHSVDATNWELAPCAFGNWQKFGAMSVRGSNQDLRSQVRHYLDLEAKARVRWAKQMAELDALEPSPAKLGRPTVRLVANGAGGREDTKAQALGPSVRLAADAGAADGQRIEAAIGKPSKSQVAKPKVAKAKKAEPAPATTKEYQFQDYWKDRFKSQ